MVALLSLAVMAALTGVAAYTAVPRTAGRLAPRVVATALAAATAGVFVVAVDAAWSWAIPTAALAVGLPTARSPRLRLSALAVSGVFVATLWIFGLDGRAGLIARGRSPRGRYGVPDLFERRLGPPAVCPPAVCPPAACPRAAGA